MFQKSMNEYVSIPAFFHSSGGVEGHKKGNSCIFFLTAFQKHSTIE